MTRTFWPIFVAAIGGAWCAAEPLGAIPQGVLAAPAGARTAVERLRLPVETGYITIRRDPFVPFRSQASVAEPLGVLPPNQGAAQPLLRGVILGRSPRALIDVGGTLRIVATGDRLGDAIVVRITDDGVMLDDGVTLQVQVR